MILVLGGTSDSIGICNKLNEMNLPYMVSVTTEYGRDIAKKATENVFLGKLTIEDMVSLIKEKNITQIIDATHPYATIVSSNAIECSKISNTDYVRFERESLIKQIDYDDIYVVEDIEQACEIANEKGNNIFIGTGSKNLDKYIIEEEKGTFKINQSIAIQDSVNMAVALFNDMEFRAVSGKNDIENSCTLIPLGQDYFKSCKVNKLGKLGIGYNRVNDSEKKIIEEIHKLITKGKLKAEGDFTLYSKWEPCPSCYYVISQFIEKYPKINLKVMYYKEYGEK